MPEQDFDDIQDELEKITADLLWELGNTVVKGILFQVVPDSNLEVFERKIGENLKPFWSISSFKPEQILQGDGFTHFDTFVRPVTVALFSEKLNVEGKHSVFRGIRTAAMRKLSQRRSSVTDGSMILKATVQPGPRVEGAAWLRSTGFVSSFDVLWKTCEQFDYRP
jgi:hypothetical protein